MQEIGSLDLVDPRNVWDGGEARDLTPWLAEEPDVIGGALGLELGQGETEVSVGDFKADILFQEESTYAEPSKAQVVVENMLDTTDHEHMGKVITYAAGLDARYIVLLAKRFRPEHRTALNWLNKISGDEHSFFGIELKVWSIGSSAPAPYLDVVVKPDDWRRSVKRTAKERRGGNRSDKQQAYISFWEYVIPKFEKKCLRGAYGDDLPSTGRLWVKSVYPSLWYNLWFRPGGQLWVAANIDTGNFDSTEKLFRALETRRGEIDSSFGEELKWDPVEGSRISLIYTRFPDRIVVQEKEKWKEARKWLISRFSKLRDALEPVLREL